MKEVIIDKLEQIEKDNDVTILYAIESGSRAWGHYNDDSDYDIRFIYKHNDLNHYLTINNQSEVIESNDGLLDIVGWDIKKALYLHYKSNPNLREWINSPIKYVTDDEDIFRDLPDFNKGVLKHHYYGLAYRHYKKYLKGKEEFNLKYVKKMLYTIRCTLAWNVLDNDSYPSMNLDELLEENDLSKDIKDNIIKLRDSYSTLEITLNEEERILLYDWIVDALEKMMNDNSPVKNKRDIKLYNKRFQELVI